MTLFYIVINQDHENVSCSIVKMLLIDRFESKLTNSYIVPRLQVFRNYIHEVSISLFFFQFLFFTSLAIRDYNENASNQAWYCIPFVLFCFFLFFCFFAVFVMGSGMQLSFSNSVSANPQFLSFKAAQEDRPRKVTHNPIMSSGFMASPTADSNHKPYSGLAQVC